MYKRWSTPVVKRRPSPSALSLPSCPAENFYFHFQVKYEKNPVYSRSISGRRLLPFLFLNGYVGVPLDSSGNHGPIILGKAMQDGKPMSPNTNFDLSKEQMFGVLSPYE
jgi:hypothetical protein